MTRAPFLLALALGAVALGGCGSGCNVDPPPSSDTCDDPGPSPTVTAIEIGHTESGRFEPILSGSAVRLVVGGQGSDMIMAALRVTGSGLTSCIAQETELTFRGEVMSSESSPMRARQLSPAVWETGDIFLPWYNQSGVDAVITATVGNQTARVELWIEYVAEYDAPGLDASTVPDAEEPDASGSDAAADAAPDA